MSRAVDSTLAALADPTRREVVGMLARGPQSPSEMAEALSTSRPAMSRHLRVLRSAGIVGEHIQPDDARVRLYELQRKPFHDLRNWLDELEAFWSDQLEAFRAHAERSGRKRKR